MREALYDDWIPTVLGGFLAIIGLLLAAGGLYGAVSYATERRLSEFGVRMAVGAQAGQIAGLVLRQAALLCAAGVPAGVGLFVAVVSLSGRGAAAKPAYGSGSDLRRCRDHRRSRTHRGGAAGHARGAAGSGAGFTGRVGRRRELCSRLEFLHFRGKLF